MTAADRPATLPEAFQRTARIRPDAVALRTVGDRQTLRWRDYAAQVRQVAAGLAALGVGRGDAVSLMMANRIEFYPLEVAAQHVGATSFSVYNALGPNSWRMFLPIRAPNWCFARSSTSTGSKPIAPRSTLSSASTVPPRGRSRSTTSLLAAQQISISSRPGWRCSPMMSRH